jgi:hypothetical protein
MWKCSLCPQISTRKWNLKTHLQRLHNGNGNAIHLHYNRRSRPKIDSFEDIVRHDINDLDNSTHVSIGSNKSQYEQKPDFLDAFHDFISRQLPEKNKKWDDIRAFLARFNQNPRFKEMPQSVQWDMSSTYTPFPTANVQNSAPIPAFVFGFEATICEKCLFVIPLDVTIVYSLGNVGRSLVKRSHFCDPEKHVSPQQLEEIKRLSPMLIHKVERKDSLDNLYAGLLKFTCQEWTKNKINLVAVKLLEWSKKAIKIPAEPGNGKNHWAVRAIQHSYTILNDEELVEFLRICKGRTFNVFELNTDNAINTSNFYLLYVHWLPSPPLEIESMISNYF